MAVRQAPGNALTSTLFTRPVACTCGQNSPSFAERRRLRGGVQGRAGRQPTVCMKPEAHPHNKRLLLRHLVAMGLLCLSTVAAALFGRLAR